MPKLKKLKAENIKGLKELSIDFEQHGNLVVIGGPNGAGKTTTLDSVLYLFGGKSSMPKDVLRHGADHGEIVGELDSGTVARRVITKRGVRLTVKNSEGMVFSSPQAVLHDLIKAANGKSTLGFDPLKFARLTPKEQRETLKELVGLDFAALDAEREAALEQKRTAEKEVALLQSEMEGLVYTEGMPEEERAIADLLEERARREELNRENAEKRKQGEGIDRDVASLQTVIERLKEQLREAESSLKMKLLAQKKLSEEIELLQDADVSEIDESLMAAEGTNKIIRENKKYFACKNALDEAMKSVEEAENTIRGVDKRKQYELSHAKMPITGLAFDEHGVTYNGVAMELLSSSEQLLVSVGMAIALSPKLKILLIRDGSLLDDANLAVLEKIAEDNNVTILLERVGSGPEVTIELQDGEKVAEVMKEAEHAS